MFQWILFVIHKLMILCMMWFYVHRSFSLYKGCPETFQINNETILHFVNLWSKKVPVNIRYPSTINQISVYTDASISPKYVGYIISIYKQLKNKNKKIKKIQGGDILGLLRKSNIEVKWLMIYVDEEQYSQNYDSNSNWIHNITYTSSE